MKRDSTRLKGLEIVCGLALVFLMAAPMDAEAQRGRGGPRFSDENLQAAWALQATSVAKEIGLEKKKADILGEAYVASRKRYQAARRDLQEDGRGNFQAYRELAKEERGKIENALKGVAKDGQIKKVLASLGTFDRRWDSLTHRLSGCELEAGRLQEAMSVTITYVSGLYAAREEARESGDEEMMYEIFREHRDAMQERMAKILSEEEMGKWRHGSRRKVGFSPPRGARPGGGN